LDALAGQTDLVEATTGEGMAVEVAVPSRKFQPGRREQE
jgi:hypothetical protein